MMEQSTQTNMNERVFLKNWVDQKALAYSPKKKTKKEQGREVGYITL